MAMDIVGNSSNLFIFTKLPKFLILGVVKTAQAKKMRSSRVALNHGWLSPRDYYFPYGFRDYIVDKANQVTEAYSKIPQHQLENFEEVIRQNPDKVINSKLFEAFVHDYNQFGKKVFQK